MDNVFKVLAISFFMGTAVVLTATVIIYGIFVEWRHEEVSRHMFNYILATTIVFDYIMLAFYLPWIPKDHWISAILYGYIFYTVVWRLFIIVRYRFFSRKPLMSILKERLQRRKVHNDDQA